MSLKKRIGVCRRVFPLQILKFRNYRKRKGFRRENQFIQEGRVEAGRKRGKERSSNQITEYSFEN